MEPLELISDWMSGGDLTRYIAKHPDANKVSLVSIPSTVFCATCWTPHQLSDVAEGLSYLHSCDVIHGDLKGVRNRSVVGLLPYSRLASQTFSWTRQIVHESQTLVSPWSPET